MSCFCRKPTGGFPCYAEWKPKSLPWPIRLPSLWFPRFSGLNPDYLLSCPLHSGNSDLLAIPWKCLASFHLRPSHFAPPSTQKIPSDLSRDSFPHFLGPLLQFPSYGNLLWPNFLKTTQVLPLTLIVPLYILFLCSRELHEGRSFELVHWTLYAQHIYPCLAYSRCSKHACWINFCKSQSSHDWYKLKIVPWVLHASRKVIIALFLFLLLSFGHAGHSSFFSQIKWRDSFHVFYRTGGQDARILISPHTQTLQKQFFFLPNLL